MIPLFETPSFLVFLNHYRNNSFTEVYKSLVQVFSENLQWTLERAKTFFESYYGYDYRLNINIFFTIAPGQTNTSMFVRDYYTRKNVWIIAGSPDRRDLRIFVDINAIWHSTPDWLRSLLFHEITHLYNLLPISKGFGVIRNEGLAILTQFFIDTNSVINTLKKPYNDILAHQPIGLVNFRANKNKPYFQLGLGLNMWLAIYFSKLNLNYSPNFSNLSEDVAQYMHGSYEPVFRAWFWRFRKMTTKEFLLQYETAIKKLKLKNIFGKPLFYILMRQNR